MTLADKIILLRKKQGWSQEELADKMDISRQAVSKWEMEQSVPDLDKIIQMSELFGVTTDYLLKDTKDEAPMPEIKQETKSVFAEGKSNKQLTLEEANRFLASERKASGKYAFGVFECIFSPVPLLFLLALWYADFSISEGVAQSVGVIFLLLIIASAVVVFILAAINGSEFDYIRNGRFEADQSVTNYVQEQKRNYKHTFANAIATGVALCVVSPVPLIAVALTENDELAIFCVCLLLFFVAIGVALMTFVGIRWGALNDILKEGEYSNVENKKKNNIMKPISSIFWLSVIAGYLGYSFYTKDWNRSWIIWPVAGLLFGVVSAVIDAVVYKGNPPEDD